MDESYDFIEMTRILESTTLSPSESPSVSRRESVSFVGGGTGRYGRAHSTVSKGREG